MGERQTHSSGASRREIADSYLNPPTRLTAMIVLPAVPHSDDATTGPLRILTMTDRSVIFAHGKLENGAISDSCAEAGPSSARREGRSGQGAKACLASAARSAVQPRGTRGGAAPGHHRCGTRRIRRTRLHRNAA